MKTIALATALIIATGTTALAQAPATGDPHHPPQAATPAPQTPAPQGQPGPGPGHAPSDQPAHGMTPGMMPMMHGMMPMMHQQAPAGSMQQARRHPQPNCPMMAGMAGSSDGMMQGMMQMMLGMMQMMQAQMHSGQSRHGPRY